MTFWKWQNYGDSKKINGCWGGAETNRQSTEDFQGSETILYDTIMMNKCYYKFVQIHRM